MASVVTRNSDVVESRICLVTQTTMEIISCDVVQLSQGVYPESILMSSGTGVC